jgi:hypothetical protein
MHRITPAGQPLRTSSGTTGMDALIYEYAALANAQRELDERASLLARHAEVIVPEDARIIMQVSGDRTIPFNLRDRLTFGPSGANARRHTEMLIAYSNNRVMDDRPYR